MHGVYTSVVVVCFLFFSLRVHRVGHRTEIAIGCYGDPDGRTSITYCYRGYTDRALWTNLLHDFTLAPPHFERRRMRPTHARFASVSVHWLVSVCDAAIGRSSYGSYLEFSFLNRCLLNDKNIYFSIRILNSAKSKCEIFSIFGLHFPTQLRRRAALVLLSAVCRLNGFCYNFSSMLRTDP